MRVNEFWTAVTDEFGAGYGATITHDLVLGELGEHTAQQAIAKGVDARQVWLALCSAADVPESRWYGVGQREPKR